MCLKLFVSGVGIRLKKFRANELCLGPTGDAARVGTRVFVRMCMSWERKGIRRRELKQWEVVSFERVKMVVTGDLQRIVGPRRDAFTRESLNKLRYWG